MRLRAGFRLRQAQPERYISVRSPQRARTVTIALTVTARDYLALKRANIQLHSATHLTQRPERSFPDP